MQFHTNTVICISLQITIISYLTITSTAKDFSYINVDKWEILLGDLKIRNGLETCICVHGKHLVGSAVV